MCSVVTLVPPPANAFDSEPDEGALVGRAQAGDERAFAALYHRHAKQVARVVSKIMGPDLEFDDLVQNTFIEVSRTMGKLRTPSAFGGYCATIAVRLCQRVLQQRRRRAWLQLLMPDHETTVPAEPTASNRDVDVDTLYAALDELSPKLRVPWVLHRVEEQTLPNVAQLCDVSLATVKRRIAAAEVLLNRRLHAR